MISKNKPCWRTSTSCYQAMLAAAPAVQGEPVAWSGWGCQHPGKMPRLYGERRIAELNCDWENGDQLLHFTAAPQPTERKPSLQSPPDDPLGGLEHRADGESNFYTLSRPTGKLVARIQFNVELHTHEQERILNAMLSDRNVRYSYGYHQGYWAARQESPDVAQLVEALEASTHRLHEQAEGEDDCRCSQCRFVRLRDAALAAHRKQGGGA